LTPGGQAFQTATGVADPHGAMAAVINEPNLCEVLLLPALNGQASNFLFVAYGSSGMNCPTPEDFIQVFAANIDDPTALQTAIPAHYGWEGGVMTGLVNVQLWQMR
jgi:hypothetical protein